MMKLRITAEYCILDYMDGHEGIVLLHMINCIPFTFDDEGFDTTDEEIITKAVNNPKLTIEDLYRWSSYLIEEECHPIMFEMGESIENYQDVPN
jgi:hypothetical protein